MSETRQKLVHLHSAVEKLPKVSDLNYGEIAVQYVKSKPVLYIKNSEDEIVKFIDEAAIKAILGSYVATSALTTDYATSANTHNAITGATNNINAVSGSLTALSASIITNYATSANTVAAIEAVAQKLVNVYTYKGSVATYENLPSTDLTIGDVYNVEAAHGNIPPGTNYAWNGSAWDSLGGNVDLSNYATTGSVETLSGAVQTLEGSAHSHDNISVLNGIGSQDIENWDAASASAHNHSNKSLLDTYTQTEANLADAVSKKHEHANMSVLTGITSQQVSNWDSGYETLTAHTADTNIHVTTAQTSAWDAKQDEISDLSDIRNNASSGASAYTGLTAHTADTNIHVTTAQTSAWDAKQDALSNENVLTGITSQQVSSWDVAANSAHNHTNASVLDSITSAKTDNWDAAYTTSQSSLIGIETGKEKGASVNANNELDFSGLYIDCGTY